MSTDKNSPQQVAPVTSPLSLRELAEVLVKHYGLHEGRYDLSVELQIGMGGVGPDPTNLSPGVMIGVHKIGLIPAPPNGGPTTVDASAVNPAKKAQRKPSTKK